MADFEKIQGTTITQLFNALVQDKTLLKLTLLETDYQNLARVVGLVRRHNTPHFVIDIPEGFEKAATQLDICRIQFEFSGIDHIRYAFTAVGNKIAGKRIYVKMPHELERQQRRKLFRIDAPAGTRLCFSEGAHQYDMEVLNISIGGSLAALVSSQRSALQNSPFAVGQRLENVALIFPAEIMQQPIQIDAVQIKRIEKDSEAGRYEAGFEFCKIGHSEQKRLTDLIYKLQRQHLRHRLPLDL
jgi:c-di-GMP-binding flagellar brake protein YcgR